MKTDSSLRAAKKRFAALLGLLGMTLAFGACKDNNSNTAPLVAASLTADASTNGQTAVAGTAVTLPVSVHVMDQNGEPLGGATVTWSVVNGAGHTGAASSTTDASGMATTAWTLDTLTRLDSLTASIQSGAKVTFTARGTAAQPFTATMVSGNNQVDASGATSAPFVIMVRDRYNNPAPGIVTAWTSTGGGTLTASSTSTGSDGKTQTTLVLGQGAANYTVTATPTGLPGITFNLVGTP